jgi:hypothetical protein
MSASPIPSLSAPLNLVKSNLDGMVHLDYLNADAAEVNENVYFRHSARPYNPTSLRSNQQTFAYRGEVIDYHLVIRLPPG